MLAVLVGAYFSGKLFNVTIGPWLAFIILAVLYAIGYKWTGMGKSEEEPEALESGEDEEKLQ